MQTRFRLVDAATVVAAGCALIITFVVVRDRLRQPPPETHFVGPDTTRVANWASLVAGASHSVGPTHATVTIVEFGDFECPFCQRYERVLTDLRAKYPTELSVVFRHLPLSMHRFAYPAARAAECAGAQGRFDKYHDALYQHQDSLGLISFTALARAVDVPNLAAFDTCQASSAKVLAIEQDIAAAGAIKIHATPTVVVNGLMFRAPPGKAGLDSVIAGLIARSVAVRTDSGAHRVGHP